MIVLTILVIVSHGRVANRQARRAISAHRSE
jgi:hypothetical protein